jgi:hypothetical protein
MHILAVFFCQLLAGFIKTYDAVVVRTELNSSSCISVGRMLTANLATEGQAVVIDVISDPLQTGEQDEPSVEQPMEQEVKKEVKREAEEGELPETKTSNGNNTINGATTASRRPHPAPPYDKSEFDGTS